ncbi:MAG: phosphatase PAP2 family protein [Desulfobacterales bacterium]|jgi:membrane-associated phospholipid phosphatase
MSKPENILDWGIEVVLWLQEFSPALDLPFKSLTFLGNLEFFLIFMPLIYWCFNRRTGARLLILFLISAYINSIAKVIADQPRPFQYDSRVKALVPAGGGGLPSGHTQSAVVVWGYLVSQTKRRILWILGGFLMIAIPVSRLYLGVHFPTDLFGGYLLGILLLVLYLQIALKVEVWLIQKGIVWQMGLAILLPVLLLGFNPEGSVYSLNAGSVLLGFVPGLILERRWIRFSSGGRPSRRLLRFLTGFIVLIGIWMGLRIAFAGLEPAALFRMVRYGLAGAWCALGAPWLFVRLKLAETE